jgi:hypothetical protein
VSMIYDQGSYFDEIQLLSYILILAFVCWSVMLAIAHGSWTMEFMSGKRKDWSFKDEQRTCDRAGT